jgi:hypothetical protein
MSRVDLTEFLMARIAEDEAVARRCRQLSWEFDDGVDHAQREGMRRGYSIVPRPRVWGPDPSVGGGSQRLDGIAWGDLEHMARHDPAHILAECEAKRRIIDLITEDCPHPWVSEDGRFKRMLGGWCHQCDAILRLMASAYSDHPDHRDAFKPRLR